MGIVVVRGTQHLVARLQRQAVVDQRQAGGGVGGQADILGPPAQVVGDPGLRLQRQVVRVIAEHRMLDRREGIAVQRLAVAIDGRLHRARVAGEEETGEMRVGRIKRELRAHRIPVRQVGGRHLLRRCRRQRHGKQGSGAQHGRGGKQVSTGQGHGGQSQAGRYGPGSQANAKTEGSRSKASAP